MSDPSNSDDLAKKFFENFPGASVYDLEDYKEYLKLQDVLDFATDIIFPSIYDGMPIPVREWDVEGWIPKHCVTGLYGDGGVGKSLLAMMLMTCKSQGIDFLGLPTTQSKCFGFFCEDTVEELHRRQNDVNIHYGLEFGQLQNMAWQSRVGFDNILMTFKNGLGVPTEAYRTLKENVMDIKASFVIIDTAADTFGGNENARPEVRQYINLLGQLAKDINGSVLLCAHPSLSGLTSGSGSGGSTAWNNTLRSRLYLKRPETGKDEEGEKDNALRELHKMKSNYSSVGDKIELIWKEGAFKVVGNNYYDVVSNIEKNIIHQRDEDKFMILLAELYLSGRVVSESPYSKGNYAPKIMAKMSAAEGITIKRFADAMQRLFDQKKIKIGDAGYYPNRTRKLGIIAS